jgi:hypothetical protein
MAARRRRWPVAVAVPLAPPGGELAHLVVTVERRPWLLTLRTGPDT